MATYNDLTPANYYLIQEAENSGLELIYIPMTTDKCVLVEYQDDDQTLIWYKKTEEFFEVIDQLTEEQAVIYESLFDEEEEDEDFGWDFEDEEEEETEEIEWKS